MNKTELIENFLKLILEIKKNGIAVDENLVYANLIKLGTKKESIENYFTSWISKFQKNENTNVFVSENWKYFCQFIGRNSKTPTYNKLKVYIPLDKDHIYAGVNDIFEFTSRNNIPHKSKVGKHTRFDDVVLRVDSISDAEKIRNFVNNNGYLKEGLIRPNPFAFTDGNIAFAWDGDLSYNTVVSEWISSYINSRENVSYNDFLQFIKQSYSEIFIKGNGINELAESKKMYEPERGLSNYQRVTELLMLSLSGGSLRDFYVAYQNIINVEKDRVIMQNIRMLLEKEKVEEEITPDKKEIFDYAFMEMAKKDGPEYAIMCFKDFIHRGRYDVFTRTNNVRYLLMQNIDREMMQKLIIEEQKNVLNEASFKTFSKYNSIQLARALFNLKAGNYNGFTNDENARANLKMLVDPKDVDSLIHDILIAEGYSDLQKDEEIWVYIELIEKLKEKVK